MPTSLEYSPLLAPDRLFSPRIWHDPTDLDTEFHPNAYFEIRGVKTSGGHGHQVNFTDKGALILSGVSAGTADNFAPINLEDQWDLTAHLDGDVTPFVWAL